MIGRPVRQPTSKGSSGGRPPPERYRPWTKATIIGISSLILPAFSLFQLYHTQQRKWFAIYTCGISIWTFLHYGYDKMQARNQDWRVKEAKLHFLAMIGGWPGALLGMHYFQHKTSKKVFIVKTWLIIAAWQGLWCWMCKDVIMLYWNWINSTTGGQDQPTTTTWKLVAR